MENDRTCPPDDPSWETVRLTPSTLDTFKRADGELIHDEYGWVSDLDNVVENLEEPQQFVQETWRRTFHRVFWLLPEPYGSCEFPMPDPEGDPTDLCEEDAVNWWRDPDTGKWLLVCSWHDPGEGTTVTVCAG